MSRDHFQPISSAQRIQPTLQVHSSACDVLYICGLVFRLC